MSQPDNRPEVGAAADEGRDFVSPAAAARSLGVDDDSWRGPARAFPVRWPAGYLALAAAPGGEPIRRMGLPDPAELVPAPGDLADPVGEGKATPHPFVVRKHRDRAILLVTARCHFYCRFCFRRGEHGDGHRDPTRAELDSALAYLLNDPAIDEIILSGGDPLVLDDLRLGEILATIAASPTIRSVRVHTRAPVHFPKRVTAELCALLASGPAVWLVTHFNHPIELTAEVQAGLSRLRAAGIPLLNQAVLLAGVNDDVEVLAALHRELYRARVKPYYLHHPDSAPGNASFRVSIARGLALYADLRTRLSGPALPTYVIDPPDGSGKVAVESLTPLGGGRYRVPATGLEFADSVA